MFDLVYLRALVRSVIGPSHAPIITKASKRIQRYLLDPSLCDRKILNTHGGQPPIASSTVIANNNDIYRKVS